MITNHYNHRTLILLFATALGACEGQILDDKSAGMSLGQPDSRETQSVVNDLSAPMRIADPVSPDTAVESTPEPIVTEPAVPTEPATPTPTDVPAPATPPVSDPVLPIDTNPQKECNPASGTYTLARSAGITPVPVESIDLDCGRVIVNKSMPAKIDDSWDIAAAASGPTLLVNFFSTPKAAAAQGTTLPAELTVEVARKLKLLEFVPELPLEGKGTAPYIFDSTTKVTFGVVRSNSGELFALTLVNATADQVSITVKHLGSAVGPTDVPSDPRGCLPAAGRYELSVEAKFSRMATAALDLDCGEIVSSKIPYFNSNFDVVGQPNREIYGDNGSEIKMGSGVPANATVQSSLNAIPPFWRVPVPLFGTLTGPPYINPTLPEVGSTVTNSSKIEVTHLVVITHHKNVFVLTASSVPATSADRLAVDVRYLGVAN